MLINQKIIPTSRSKLYLAAFFLSYPYFDRLLKSEGGLLLFTIAYAWFTKLSLADFTVSFLITSLTFFCLFAYNDFTDRFHDLRNPKKNKTFTNNLIDNQRLFLISYAAVLLFLLLLILLLFDLTRLAIFILVICSNTLYSKLLKSVPLADIAITVIIASLFVFLTTYPFYSLAITAGIMTGMAHVFQMLTDYKADRISGIKTTIVKYPGSSKIAIAVLCLLLALCYWVLWIPVLFFTTFIPLVIATTRLSVGVQWGLSKTYFTIAWFTQLYLFLN